jgi:hypothetical protein
MPPPDDDNLWMPKLCHPMRPASGIGSQASTASLPISRPPHHNGRALLPGIKIPGPPGQITLISQDGGWRLLQRR